MLVYFCLSSRRQHMIVASVTRVQTCAHPIYAKYRACDFCSPRTAMIPTDSAARALSILRDPSHFAWYVIPLLLLVLYVYAQQVRARQWPVVFGGLAFWCMDWINEIWNSLLFHFTQYAPAWGAPGETAYLILIGLNVAICLMFAVMGVTSLLLLPADPRLKLLGINNRLFLAVLHSLLAVGVDCWLNAIGALTWEYH